MTDRKETVWEMDPHTSAKHAILGRYLKAWFPVLSSRHGRLVYIDGFAGPGRYAHGEEGSPVIAIRTAVEHSLQLAKEIIFYFIEARPDRAESLKRVLQERFPNPPSNIKWKVVCAKFAEELSRALDALEKEGAKLAPTFAFLDPFGFGGLPMEVVTRLLKYERSEVLITFMAKFVNRFSETGSHEAHLDELFGTGEWRGVRDIQDPKDRREFLLALYIKVLSDRVPNVHIRTFEMKDSQNQVLYYLVFCTKSAKGMEVMKEAMWATDPTGAYRFSDLTDPAQRTLLDLADEPAWEGPAAKAVYAQFQGQWVSVEKIRDYVILETPYIFRRGILRRLENEKKIIEVRGRKKAGAFPHGCLIKFA